MMNKDLIEKVRELGKNELLYRSSKPYFDEIETSAEATEVSGNHSVSHEIKETYRRRAARKGIGEASRASLEYASQAFDAAKGALTKIWLVKTKHFSGYLFVDVESGGIIAAPFGRKGDLEKRETEKGSDLDP
jgi:hypothetical protein